MKLVFFLVFSVIISGCIYTPKKVTIYDEKCDITVKHMKLESKQIESLTACENENCYASVLGAGVLSAGSVIISGSIVITSNIAYWFEKQAQCH